MPPKKRKTSKSKKDDDFAKDSNIDERTDLTKSQT